LSGDTRAGSKIGSDIVGISTVFDNASIVSFGAAA
jgi:hypothetical protein